MRKRREVNGGGERKSDRERKGGGANFTIPWGETFSTV